MKLLAFTLAVSLGCASAAYAQQGGTINTAYAQQNQANSETDAQSQQGVSDAAAVHILNRLTFGPAPGDIDRVKAMGLRAYIDEQMHPEVLPESPIVQEMVRSSSTLRSSNQDLILEFRARQEKIREIKKKEGDKAELEDNKKLKQLNGFYKELRQHDVDTKLARCIESPKQLQEVMTEFWFNHFNVYLNKGLDTILVESYENQAIRPNALGNFRNLVEATCHHPAMLFYLDNWENTAPNSPGAHGKGLNENYARELMELHTLGVDGGYTQRDVTELARVLTGLSLGPQRPQKLQFGRAQLIRQMQMKAQMQPVDYFGAVFYPQRHDFGTKTILGYRIPGSGEMEIEQCIDMLVHHPSTAHHISYELCQYFVCDKPPASLVDRVAARFQQTDGDIKSVLQELFSSPEFWDPKNENAKYKTPLRFAVSALRASNAHVNNYAPVEQFLRSQGEIIYGCITPDGYKNTKEAWLNPDGLIRRINFATALAAGHMAGEEVQPPDYRMLGATISDSRFSAHTVAVVNKAPASLKSAVVLGSPEFMHY